MDQKEIIDKILELKSNYGSSQLSKIKRYTVNPPCEIIHLQLGMSLEYKKELIEETHKLKNRANRENDYSFKHVFMESNEEKVIGSSYDLSKESDVYNVLFDHILREVSVNSYPGIEYKIQNAWAGIYKREQLALPHAHEPNYKSFCYYISAEEPYTPMVFDDVGLEIDAITDRLIIFPSFIRHSVPPCKGGERIMVAGNIIPWEKPSL